MTNDEMPSVIHGIEIFGPSEDLEKLKREVNDKLEEFAKAVINGIQIYDTSQGWVIMFWFKLLPKSTIARRGFRR